MKTIFEISNRLRATLKESGRTQEDVRSAAGLSRQTAVNVFKGTEDFKLSTLLAVADKLGLELVLLPRAAARGLDTVPSDHEIETLVQRAMGERLQLTPAAQKLRALLAGEEEGTK